MSAASAASSASRRTSSNRDVDVFTPGRLRNRNSFAPDPPTAATPLHARAPLRVAGDGGSFSQQRRFSSDDDRRSGSTSLGGSAVLALRHPSYQLQRDETRTAGSHRGSQLELTHHQWFAATERGAPKHLLRRADADLPKPFRKKNGSIVVPQAKPRRPLEQLFAGEVLHAAPSTSVAPSASVPHVSEFFPAATRNMCVESLQRTNNPFFMRNRKPPDGLRPGTPLWKTCGEVNFSTVRYPAEFIATLARPDSAFSNRSGLRQEGRPGSSASSGRFSTAADRCRGLKQSILKERDRGRSANTAVSLNVSRISASRPSSSSPSPRAERTENRNLSATGSPNWRGASASRRSTIVTIAPDTDSEEEYLEREVRALERWVPTQTEVQVMASKVQLKYRTSRHRAMMDGGGADGGFTVWDYCWEKPVEKDARVLAEMQRCAPAMPGMARGSSKVTTTSRSPSAEHLSRQYSPRSSV